MVNSPADVVYGILYFFLFLFCLGSLSAILSPSVWNKKRDYRQVNNDEDMEYDEASINEVIKAGQVF